MSLNEQELFRFIFTIIFIIAAALLIFLLIRKNIRDKKYGMYYEERNGKITTQQMCSLVIMLPAFFEFLMNTYYQLIRNLDTKELAELNYWYSILDLLFILCAILVYTNSSIKWIVLVTNVVQVYTFAPSITRHINDGLTIPLVNFIVAFVYYVIVACVLIRIMFPRFFVRTGKVARIQF